MLSTTGSELQLFVEKTSPSTPSKDNLIDPDVAIDPSLQPGLNNRHRTPLLLSPLRKPANPNAFCSDHSSLIQTPLKAALKAPSLQPTAYRLAR
ncbi:hypothetical protein PGT21_010851 [Puccinia graminis f. sp. tritici]|uniref:Uncharacterized protein n=1 Tax=Puccinia graminis f. sp. tritici TaxID=56615 RepID=A0A5B0NQA7_PUCGR|nr:hypothetical protein PGT21_010851 [Puccinia graminis f. sp. tritici]